MTDKPRQYADTRQQKRHRIRINAKRKAQIPDSTAFVDKLATPAIQGYDEVLNPAFHSKGGLNTDQIKANHASNIQRAFEKYNSQMDFLFDSM